MTNLSSFVIELADERKDLQERYERLSQETVLLKEQALAHSALTSQLSADLTASQSSISAFEGEIFSVLRQEKSDQEAHEVALKKAEDSHLFLGREVGMIEFPTTPEYHALLEKKFDTRMEEFSVDFFSRIYALAPEFPFGQLGQYSDYALGVVDGIRSSAIELPSGLSGRVSISVDDDHNVVINNVGSDVPDGQSGKVGASSAK